MTKGGFRLGSGRKPSDTKVWRISLNASINYRENVKKFADRENLSISDFMMKCVNKYLEQLFK